MYCIAWLQDLGPVILKNLNDGMQWFSENVRSLDYSHALRTLYI